MPDSDNAPPTKRGIPGWMQVVGCLLVIVLLIIAAPFCMYLFEMVSNQITAPLGDCAEPSYKIPTSESARAMVDQGLVTGEPCAAPCWQHITPRVTTYQEASGLLKNNPLVKGESLDLTSLDYMWWQSSASSPGVNGWISFRDGLVNQITVDLEYPLTVGQVIALLGEPDYVGVQPYLYPDAPAPPCDSLTLVWMTHGVELVVPDIDERKAPAGPLRISPETQGLQVWYFQATTSFEDFISSKSSRWDYKGPYQPWQGLDRITRPKR